MVSGLLRSIVKHRISGVEQMGEVCKKTVGAILTTCFAQGIAFGGIAMNAEAWKF